MVELSYYGADGLRHDIEEDDAKMAIRRLSAIPGYVNRNADELTAGLGSSLKARRKQRASDFASQRTTSAGIQSPVASKGIGATTIIPGFGGNIVEDGRVVGCKIYDIKVENGLIVGTSGMREERYKTETEEAFNTRLEKWFKGWWGGWWASNWRTYAYWK